MPGIAAGANFNQLIQDLKQSNPRLYDALKLLGASVDNINLELFPPLTFTPQPRPATQVPVLASFSYRIDPDSVLFSWALLSGIAIAYELRVGVTFDTADIVLRSDTNSARLAPMLEGSYTFWVQAIGTEQNSAPLSVNVIIPPIGSFSTNASVIDNNVLLSWIQPVSAFRIEYYEVYRNGTTDLVGTVGGTFFVVFEQASGAYTYNIFAYDVAGNRSPISSASTFVSQPPDFELQAEYKSDLTHAKENAYRDPSPHLIVAIAEETWEEHFVEHNWESPADQVAAGYPIYIQPTNPTAQYDEIHDFGVIINDTVVTISYSIETINPSGHDVAIQLWTSVDNITWSGPFNTESLFVTSIRYLQVIVNFTARN